MASGGESDQKINQTDQNHLDECCCSRWAKCSLFKRCGANGKIEPFSCWVTLAASFSVNILVAALETTFPLFYDPLRDKYNATRANVGISASLVVSMGSISALLCTPLMNIYGCRPVASAGSIMLFTGLLLSAFAPNIILFHLSFGLLAGVGMGLLYIPSLSIVQQSFTHNRGLATGLSLLGFTAGTILSPILFEYLLREYGLFGSLLLQCGVHAQGIVLVQAFQSPPKYRENAKENTDQSIEIQGEGPERKEKQHLSYIKSFCSRLADFSVCKDIKFVLYVAVRLLWFFSKYCMNIHVVSAAIHLGVGLKQARYLPAIMGLSNLVMRVFSTCILNIKKLNKEIYFSAGIVCVAVACFMGASAKQYGFLLASMILVGCNEGMTTTSQPLVVSNLVGIESFPKAMAIVEVATVPASMAAGPFSGWLVDRSGNYVITFLVAGIAGILAFVTINIITVLLYCDKRRGTKQQEVTVNPQELEPLEVENHIIDNIKA